MRRGAKVLSVGRNRRNQELLAAFLHGHGFTVRPAFTLEDVDRALDRTEAYDAALVDLSGYDRRIWERCERMRAEGVPFFVIGPAPNPVAPRTAARHGASGYIAKPLPKRVLLGLVRYLVQ